ncbi:hypothetical protein NY98_02845 [Xanthomonas citri pv. fuscans]|uniref:Uncharacterized protein n=3 Tax=Xanthomonas TaxID=338 RepID=A0AB34QBU2_XANCI|nr:hypothetical protein AC609_18695 [Xanthomonas phaseoli pv. phaseoli]AZU19002.1 hypothetical protein AC613_18665 [Xanthomonas citri pv. fuscans]AZU32551.1 hypothetical protein AC801_23195 [Xanthomonas sp. ISO98C4]AZU22950.1 hypothetical protein AC612_18670 [Xanthomonas citri pv. fuscans]AZU27436.1 hypothetical protein AC611_18715 [Xanthomonas phaseoli pv. phaseoli]
MLVDVSGLMEAGFMESGPSAIHVSILASSLHEGAPAAEPMGLENEVFCIEENRSAGPFFEHGILIVWRRAPVPRSTVPPIQFQLARRGFRPC